MKGLMRDTAFGQIVRLVSGRRFFKYSEEENHELWKSFIDEKKSANLARHGTVEPPEDDDEKEKEKMTKLHEKTPTHRQELTSMDKSTRPVASKSIRKRAETSTWLRGMMKTTPRTPRTGQ
jgi:hypothetical protein